MLPCLAYHPNSLSKFVGLVYSEVTVTLRLPLCLTLYSTELRSSHQGKEAALPDSSFTHTRPRLLQYCCWAKSARVA